MSFGTHRKKFLTISDGTLISRMDFSLRGQPMRISIIMVDQYLATHLMTFNHNNRKVKHNQLALLKRVVLDNRWKMNGSTIVFSSDGILLDGQHRLLSVIGTDRVVEMILIEGVEPSAGDLINTNEVPRTIADILHYRGIDAACVSQLAAIAKIFMYDDDGIGGSSDSTLLTDYIEFHMDQWAPIVTWAMTLSKQSPLTKALPGKNHCLTGSALAAIHIYMERSGADLVRHMEFANGVATGMYASETDRITFSAMRRRLVDKRPLKISSTGGSYSILMHEYAVWIAAYNRWVTGDPVQVCRDVNGDFKTLKDLPKPVVNPQVQRGVTRFD